MNLRGWLVNLLDSRRRRKPNHPRGKPASCRPRLERLETRALLTAFSLGSTGFDSADSVALDSAGNQYVCGTFKGTVDFDPGPGTHNLTSTGSPDAFVAKYSPTGQLLWAGQIVDAGSTNGYRLGLTLGSDGDVFLTGHFSGTTDFDLGPGVSTLSAGASSAAFVARYTADGGLTWAEPRGWDVVAPG